MNIPTLGVHLSELTLNTINPPNGGPVIHPKLLELNDVISTSADETIGQDELPTYVIDLTRLQELSATINPPDHGEEIHPHLL